MAERTEGYSGSDMKQLVVQACLAPVRELYLQRGQAGGTDSLAVSKSELRKVCLKDFAAAAKAVKPTVSAKDVAFYEEWDHLHGAARANSDGAEDIEEW